MSLKISHQSVHLNELHLNELLQSASLRPQPSSGASQPLLFLMKLRSDPTGRPTLVHDANLGGGSTTEI